jgi:hypothetical protein
LNAAKHWDIHRVQLLFVAILATIVVGAFGLIWAHQFLPQRALPSPDLIIGVYRSYVLPKPTEQFVFALLASTVPIVALMMSMSQWKSNLIQASAPSAAMQKMLPFVVAALLFSPLVRSEFVTTIIGEYGNEHSHGFAAIVAASVAAAAGCIWSVLGRRSPIPSKWKTRSTAVGWVIFLSAVALQMLAWRLVSVASVTRSGVWSTHADPVFYALSQVVAGKTLMVDLPSQYGLFPEMIGPLFKLIGLSVFKLSVVFAAMQVVSLAAVYYVLSRLIKSRLLLVVTGLALVMLTFESVLYFVGIDERYYQYWPIRFFWPAVSVLGFYCFAHRRTLTRGCIVSLMGAIGLLWNLDSGLFISVAYGAYLGARLISVLLKSREAPTADVADRWNVRAYLIAIALHVLITVVVVAAFLTALTWKAHKPLDLFWLLEYQRIFYSLGLMMLPLPRQLDPWMSVLGVYLIGLLAALTAWRRRLPRVKDDVLFYLSMLGLGLFVYYEGRSHVLNLVTVCWPVALIVAILADELLRAIRARLLPMGKIWLPIAAISLLLLACASFAARAPRLLHDAARQYATRGVTEELFVRSELALIREHAAGRRECLIISQRQGIYYAESGLGSPLKGPGFVEMLLKADQDQLVSQVLNGGIPCIFLGIGAYTNAGLKLDAEKMREKYSIVATNAQNTMQYLEAKP